MTTATAPRSVLFPSLLCLLSVFLPFIFATEVIDHKGQSDVRRERRSSSAIWGSHGLWHDIGLPAFWENGDKEDYGLVIRGWKLAKCASSRWTDYVVDVKDLVIWPKYPRFPGPLFFNSTIVVRKDLSRVKIELEVEMKHLARSAAGKEFHEPIPCHGWDPVSGCGGFGSCRYCSIMHKCRETILKAVKYVSDQKVQQAMKKPEQFCPPPQGEWVVTFSKILKLDDLPRGFLKPLQSNGYWFTLKFTDDQGRHLSCSRIWMDICKYRMNDREQRCLRDNNFYTSLISNIG
ncbi:unnamed protein product [Soboliphyme baturini]|uniref:DUF4773 domain-containing protein n=1 Tax=Soboliphyme baturini TaxID=241478 RepID=A0A183IGG5_9BILA|nr:unnamed protein product [Soboliphyme baturini]